MLGLVLVSCACGPQAPASASPLATERHHFDIDPTDPKAAIREFGRQSGVQVVVPGDELQGKKLGAVKGDLSVDDALERLLAGTGLTYHYVGERTVALMAAPDAAPGSARRTEPGRSRRREPAAVDRPARLDKLVEEIDVTAQHRAERLQEMPISAEVVEGQELAEQNLNTLDDLSGTVPSVHVGHNGRSVNLYIRGIGSGENQAFDQSVGIFADDIYHGRGRMAGATFLDLERIEILKGPQSTFFGNNTTAGAFNIVTKKPSNQFEAWTRGLYGEHGDYAAEGAVGGPMAGTFAARAAATVNGSTGWLSNQTIGRKVPGQNNMAGRLTLLFKPSDALDAMFKIEAGRERNIGGLALQGVDCPPPAPFVAASFCKVAIGLGVPTGLDNNNIAQNQGQQITLNTAEYVLTANYHAGDHTITWVSGYYGYRYNFNLDNDGTPETLFNVQVPEHYHQFSQELRIASPTGHRIEYLGGIYFHTDQLFVSQQSSLYFLTPTLAAAPSFAGLAPYLPLAQNINFTQPEKTYSGFGSTTWNVTDSLKLSAGLRASWVRKTYDWNLLYGTATAPYGAIAPISGAPAALAQTFANSAALGVAGTLSGSRTDHALMPSTRIQYSVAAAAMAYFSYSRGFKAGGFNGADSTGVAGNLPFAPEHVDAYELGFKSEWFDRTVLLNVDLFRSDYSNLQVTQNLATGSGGLISLVRNAASSQSQGVELQAQWVAGGFRLSSNVAYDDAHYVRYPNVSPTQLQQFLGVKLQDLSGRPTEFAPQWSGMLTGAYTVHLPRDYQLTTELAGLFSSGYFLNGVDDPTLEQHPYARFDSCLSFAKADKRWTLDLIGKNLTNQNILTFGTAWRTTSLGSTMLQKEEPRNVAVQVRFRW